MRAEGGLQGETRHREVGSESPGILFLMEKVYPEEFQGRKPQERSVRVETV